MADRYITAEANVAICRVIGLDPEGIKSMTLTVDRDGPSLTVTYSARYLAQLVGSLPEGEHLADTWEWQLVPKVTDTTEVGDEWASSTPMPVPPEIKRGGSLTIATGTPPFADMPTPPREVVPPTPMTEGQAQAYPPRAQ